MNPEPFDFNQSGLSYDGLKQQSDSASSSGSVSGLITVGGAAAASLIPGVGPIVAVGIGTIGAVTTAYQLAIKQRADRKIDRIVYSVQDELKGRGLYSGEVDGILGPETKNAIAKVQEDDTSLQVTGELDDKTLGSIINATGSSPSG
jgi:hypothetical protein